MNRKTFLSGSHSSQGWWNTGAIWLFSMLFSALPHFAFSQAAPVLDLPLEDLLQVEVVSASKRPTRISDTPAVVEIITAEDIARHGYRTVADVLQRIIGFNVSRDRNYEYLGVRGISLSGDYNSRTLILVDGHRINDPIFDEGAIGNHLPVDLKDIVRIEIVKGPGSAVWGTNALLAVINIFTKSANDIDGARVSAEIGSDIRRKGTAQFGEEFENGLKVSGSYSALGSRGEESIYFPEFDSEETNFGLAQYNDKESYQHGFLRASYEGLSFLFLGGTRKRTVPTASFETIFNSQSEYTIDDSLRAELIYEDDFLEEYQGNYLVRVAFDSVRYRGQYPYPIEGSDEESLFRDYSFSKRIGAEARIRGRPTDWLELVLGSEISRAYDLENGSATITPEYSEDALTHNDYYNGAAFGIASISLSDKVLFETGLRFDRYTTSGNSTNPRAAVIYKPVKGTSLKALYGTAFRAPNDYELHLDSSLNAGNPNLVPEELESYELAWGQRISERTQLTLSVFHLKLEDIIAQTVDPSGLLVFQNSGEITSQGVELMGRTSLTSSDELSGFWGVTYVDAHDDTQDSHLANSPFVMANLGASVSLFDRKLFVSPEFRLVGPQTSVKGGHLASTTVFDVTLLARDVVPDLELALSCYNIFAEDIYYSGANEHRQDRIPGEGRAFRFSVDYRF